MPQAVKDLILGMPKWGTLSHTPVFCSPKKVECDILLRRSRKSCCGALLAEGGAATLVDCVQSCAVPQLDGEAAADAVRSLHDVARVSRYNIDTINVAVGKRGSLVWRRHGTVRTLAVVEANPKVEKQD
jgi:hypothetical protein